MTNLNPSLIATFSVLFLMTISSCTNSRNSIQEFDLKKNSELKERVFEQILNDEELFTEFLEETRENRKAINWMESNRPMMQQMHRQMMENMMERDTTMMPMKPEMREQMMQHMMEMMERDSMMYNRMQQMMKRQNMMDNKN